ncbi:hypothetical protein TrCOL_g11538 [Triparma columacea]|uniref:S1 motif domain-containing protein n=1 Tax=Triparma columacea TaxID=722753 RepID=A0A9W7L9A6_9STRA|nr:hypothetical protein TrCOL_g11538 [Triparma columacea]
MASGYRSHEYSQVVRDLISTKSAKKKNVVKKRNKARPTSNASAKKRNKARPTSNASASHFFDEESELLEEYYENSHMSKHRHRQKEIQPPITLSRHAIVRMKERSSLPGERMHNVVKGSKVVTAYPTSRPVKYDGIANHRREAKKQSVKRVKGLGAANKGGGGSTKDAENVDHPKGANAMSEKAPISELTAGQELTGKVMKVTPWGAFVDIGYQSDGLLHISEIADDFVTKLRSILVVNQEVNVRVIAVNTKKKQVALTMRSIKAEERRGSVTGKRHAKQAAAANALADSGFDDTKMVVGEVVSTLDFGAFVRFSAVNIVEGLKGELVGLVFNSHLAKGGVKDAKSVVVVGQKVQVRVRSVDKSSGKVSLSMIPKKGEPKQRGKREKK